jgi:hypothetical protein
MDLRRLVGGVWSGFTWLRIGTVGELLWMRWWTFGFWGHGVSYIHWWRESSGTSFVISECLFVINIMLLFLLLPCSGLHEFDPVTCVTFSE